MRQLNPAAAAAVLDMYREWLSYRRANHDQDGFKLMVAAGGPAEKVPGQPQLGRLLGGRLVLGHLPLSRWEAAAAALDNTVPDNCWWWLPAELWVQDPVVAALCVLQAHTYPLQLHLRHRWVF